MNRHAGDVFHPAHIKGGAGSIFHFPAWAAWLTVPGAAVFLLLAGLIYAEPPLYRAEAQALIGPRTAELIGLRSHLDSAQTHGRLDSTAGQAQLIASRDLARQAIKELGLISHPEFGTGAQRSTPFARALIFLGLMRDPALYSVEDLALEAFQKRLQVESLNGTSFITIAFQSKDPELAAKVANRIAELYLEMRRAASPQHHNDGATIVSRATPPLQAFYPDNRLLLLSAAATIVLAGVGLTLTANPMRPRTKIPHEPPCRPERPRRVFAGSAGPQNPATEPRSKDSAQSASLETDAVGKATAMDKLLSRINSCTWTVSATAQARRGRKILVTSLGLPQNISGLTWELAHRLSPVGSSIVIGLDSCFLLDSTFNSSWPGCSQEPGLRELLDGTASFTEVIHRDPASRLHVLGAGNEGPFDVFKIRAVLDTLAETYGFLLILAPPLDRNGFTEVLVSSADFVVLALPAVLQGSLLFETQTRLLEAGAGEVLPISEAHLLPQNLRRNAA